MGAHFQDRLSASENKWEKAQIHNECEAKLGDGSPRRLCNDLVEKSKALTRKRAKLFADAQDKVRVMSLGITKVVIDGNNMCHLPFDKRFIGVAAIKAATAALHESGFSVEVIFDPSIRKLPRCPKGNAATPWLKHQIGARFVMIVPDGTRADESVLREASASHSAVVSRDNYDEARQSLGSYPVLQNDRVFSHHITSERVAISALDIDVPWSA